MYLLLIRLLNRHAQWRVIVPLLLLCAGYVWLFNVSAFPYANPALVAIGCGEGLLDARLHYNAVEAYQALACYGPAGRALYQNFLKVDVSFALCYGMAFALLLTRLVQSKALQRSADTLVTEANGVSAWHWIACLPLAVAAADGLENVLLYRLLAAYPQELPLWAHWAGAATSAKWLLSLLALAALVVGAARRWRHRTSQLTP